LFAVGTTTGKVDVFKYPSLKSICDEPISVVTDDEVLDVDINLEKEKMVSTTRDSLKLINLRGKNVGHIVQTISSATAVKNNKVNFRAFR
jgi:prolactin regulatory element-binding protein